VPYICNGYKYIYIRAKTNILKGTTIQGGLLLKGDYYSRGATNKGMV